MHTCLWNNPSQVSERINFAEFKWKYHIFLNLKTKEWDLKIFMFNYWNDLLLGSVETYFLVFHTCLWNEPPQVSESVVFAEFEEKIPRFFKSKTGELDLKILKFNYWNDFVLGSVETCFWKPVLKFLWNEPSQVSERLVFAELDWNYHIFWNVKTEKRDLKILLFNYWNDFVLRSVETCFLEVGGLGPKNYIA